MSTRRTTIIFAAIACWAGSEWLATSEAAAQGLRERIAHARRSQGKSGNEFKSRALGALLYTDLTLQLTDTPARDAIRHIGTTLGVNIVGRYNDDRSGVGIDPETSIELDVTDTPALTVLEMILDQCSDDIEECTWQLRNGFVEVGTKERLGGKSAQEIRYYPIRDLLFVPPRFDNAPDLDLDSALSQGGNSGGGGGGGGGSGGGGGGGFGGGGGGGGGRGGGGGGGRGGGGGGGGGSLFGDPGDEEDRPTEIELAQEIVDLIQEIVEPDGWTDTGGEWGQIRYYQGTLIIRAPDFMHRQIGGYPFAIRPAAVRSMSAAIDRRYVTFSGSLSDVKVVGIRESAPITGAAGGGDP